MLHLFIKLVTRHLESVIIKKKNKIVMEKFTDVIKSDKPVLVDFFATWCGPCQAMMPILDELKERIGEDARIIKLDVDKNQELAQEYNIRTVPTLMIFKNGETLWRHSGVMQASELETKLKEFA